MPVDMNTHPVAKGGSVQLWGLRRNMHCAVWFSYFYYVQLACILGSNHVCA